MCACWSAACFRFYDMLLEDADLITWLRMLARSGDAGTFAHAHTSLALGYCKPNHPNNVKHTINKVATKLINKELELKIEQLFIILQSIF